MDEIRDIDTLDIISQSQEDELWKLKIELKKLESELEENERMRQSIIFQKERQFWGKEIDDLYRGTREERLNKIYKLAKTFRTNGHKKRIKEKTVIKDSTGANMGDLKTDEEIANGFRRRIEELFRDEEEHVDTDERWNEIKRKTTVLGDYVNKIDDDLRKRLCDPPEREDYIRAMKEGKLKKAAGPDALVAEVFRLDPEFWADVAIEVEKTSIEDISEGWVAWLFKKKDKKAMLNYRPVTVLNVMYKLITAHHARILLHPHRCDVCVARGRWTKHRRFLRVFSLQTPRQLP